MRKLMLVSLGLVLAGCGGDATGPRVPSVKGNYAGTYVLTAAGPGGSASVACPLTVTVTQENRGQFSGSFLVQSTPQCDAESGSVVGEIRSDGGINFSVSVPGQDPNSFWAATGCTTLSADDQFVGTFGANRIDAAADAVIRCSSGGTFYNVSLRGQIVAAKA